MNEKMRPEDRTPRPATDKRRYAAPQLTEFGSVAKLTQGSRSVQADFAGATTFKMNSCL